MKRNFSLIRRILLDIENMPVGKVISHFDYDDFDRLVVATHIKLLIDAKLLDGYLEDGFYDGSLKISYCINGLTWEGYEFLANAKNDTIWKKVTLQAEEKGESISMFVLNQLLAAAAKKYFGLE
ncbi:MAG: DUF2513 domain-containing protein [Snowella sp.]|nr:DUF2513 domain-containing protein [Snowella sp.]